MILSKRVALGGTQLDSLHAGIVVLGVDPGTPEESISTVSRMGGFGQRVTGEHWETIDITVTYGINLPKKQMQQRKQIFDSVNTWALGKGWLTVNWMPGKRLYVDKVILPSSGDVWDWTKQYDIIFRAYGVPFWQDDTATTSTGSSINVPGMVQTVCDVEVENSGSSTIDSLTVTVGNSTMTFSSLGLAASEVLKIGHTENGLLTIRIYETAYTYRDAMAKRTGTSADDLYVNPGSNSITVSAGSKSVSCFGRYV